MPLSIAAKVAWTRRIGLFISSSVSPRTTMPWKEISGHAELMAAQIWFKLIPIPTLGWLEQLQLLQSWLAESF